MSCFFKGFQLAMICVVIAGLAGCAETRDTSDVQESDAAPLTSDSHGWGANVESAGK